MACGIYCQSCETCQTDCQLSCQTTCEVTTQCGSCQSSCQTTCESACQTTCERNSQCGSCESACQYGCEIYCQTDCESCETCQTDCQWNCQTTAQTCGSCESACQSCESRCETTCQSICEVVCESNCQYACQTGCELCQFACELSCESCETSCLYACEVSCQISGLEGNPELPPLGSQLATPTLNTDMTVKASSYIRVTINPVAGADTYYGRINNGTIQSSSSRTLTFSNLQPSTQYYIEIKCGGTGYIDSAWSAYYATTAPTGIWEWYVEKTTGSNFNVSADEWYAFCNKINEVRVANGFAEYDFSSSSTYVATGKPFYAWIFLQCANAINQINGQVATEILNVQSNDDIYAWYFDNLKTALNNAII